MTPLDGLYRHDDVSLAWDDRGVTFTKIGNDRGRHVAWSAIDGARQIGGRPGFVQLLVRDHVPPADLRTDPFSIPVASDADANRLITSIAWRPVPQKRRRFPMWRRRRR